MVSICRPYLKNNTPFIKHKIRLNIQKYRTILKKNYKDKWIKDKITLFIHEHHGTNKKIKIYKESLKL